MCTSFDSQDGKHWKDAKVVEVGLTSEAADVRYGLQLGFLLPDQHSSALSVKAGAVQDRVCSSICIIVWRTMRVSASTLGGSR